MRVISVKRLKDFWENKNHADAEQPLRAWYAEAKAADWKNPNEIKAKYHSASFVGNNRVVFNVRGNHYRLVAAIRYEFKIVYIRFIGTHEQYDKINAGNV
jgi:mRNA interferase HigB